MKTSPRSFDEMPVSRLLRDYVKGEGSLDGLFPHRDLENPASVRNAVLSSFDADRQVLAQELARYNASLGAPSQTLDSIARLKDPQTCVVVTGQQLNLLGGPLLIGYKILTAIEMAEKYTKILGSPVVPVFWLADEDHDLKETLDVALPSKPTPPETPAAPPSQAAPHSGTTQAAPPTQATAPTSFTLPLSDEGKPVGSVHLPAVIADLLDACQEHLSQELHTGAVLPLLREFYRPGVSFEEAFGSLILSWFGHMGLVLISARTPVMKALAAPVLSASVDRSMEVYARLDATTKHLLSLGYPQQAQFQSSHLFAFHPGLNGARMRITEAEGEWSLPTGERMNTEDFAVRVRNDPETYSPGVFLRLMVQSQLLPVIGIVGGPAELSYIAQASGLFSLFGKPMPLIIPRWSLTLSSPRSARWSNALPLEFSEYLGGWQTLQERLMRHLDGSGVDAEMKEWIDGVHTLASNHSELIRRIDPTLEAYSERLVTGMEKELRHLGKKLLRAIRIREADTFRRAADLQGFYFPDGTLQERTFSSFSLMCQLGPDLWDRLRTTLKGAPVDVHHIVEVQ